MIQFSKYVWIYIVISLSILLPGMYSLIRWGLKPSIDFTGGTTMTAHLQNNLSADAIRALAEKENIELLNVIVNEKTTDVTIGMKETKETTIRAFESALQKETKGLEILQKDSVGPVVGKELLDKAIIASLFAICAILTYVAYAFKNIKFGVSAIFALLHDVLVMFACFSLLGHFFGVEVDTLFVTAFLTTMSFSVHDTIVIFDRIREYRRRDAKTPLANISDMALTETMGRSLVNSFTIIFMLLSLVLLGGDTIRWFAVALLIGTITGTYSSPFVATPILVALDHREQSKQKKLQ